MSAKMPAYYAALLGDIKQRIRHAQTRAVLAIHVWNTTEKMPQPVALFTPGMMLALPWGHHAVLMEKVKDAERELGDINGDTS